MFLIDKILYYIPSTSKARAMDCAVCSPGENSKTGFYSMWKICNSCYSNTLALIDDDDNDHPVKLLPQPYTNFFLLSDERPITPGLLRLIKKLKESCDMIDFLRRNYPTDIQLLPGNHNGLPIPAHTKFLAARSNVFKNMLDEDGVLVISGNDTIVFPELTRDELNSFIEYFYEGKLSKAKLVEHSKALFAAAHKYDVPSLADSLLKVLNTKNVLGVLEISHPYPMNESKKIALKFIAENKETIVSTPEYAEFSMKNYDLSLEIQRAVGKEFYSNINHEKRELVSKREAKKFKGDRLYKVVAIILVLFNVFWPSAPSTRNKNGDAKTLSGGKSNMVRKVF